MSNVKIKNIILISFLVLILIICSSIYIFKDVKSNDKKEVVDTLNYNLEVKEELLLLMKEELSSSWHRYEDWENKIDNNPYIICSCNSRLVASIRHEEYGDIYFIFYKAEGKYYIKDYGDKIIDWKNYCK